MSKVYDVKILETWQQHFCFIVSLNLMFFMDHEPICFKIIWKNCYCSACLYSIQSLKCTSNLPWIYSTYHVLLIKYVNFWFFVPEYVSAWKHHLNQKNDHKIYFIEAHPSMSTWWLERTKHTTLNWNACNCFIG